MGTPNCSTRHSAQASARMAGAPHPDPGSRSRQVRRLGNADRHQVDNQRLHGAVRSFPKSGNRAHQAGCQRPGRSRRDLTRKASGSRLQRRQSSRRGQSRGSSRRRGSGRWPVKRKEASEKERRNSRSIVRFTDYCVPSTNLQSARFIPRAWQLAGWGCVGPARLISDPMQRINSCSPRWRVATYRIANTAGTPISLSSITTRDES